MPAASRRGRLARRLHPRGRGRPPPRPQHGAGARRARASSTTAATCATTASTTAPLLDGPPARLDARRAGALGLARRAGAGRGRGDGAAGRAVDALLRLALGRFETFMLLVAGHSETVAWYFSPRP